MNHKNVLTQKKRPGEVPGLFASPEFFFGIRRYPFIETYPTVVMVVEHFEYYVVS